MSLQTRAIQPQMPGQAACEGTGLAQIHRGPLAEYIGSFYKGLPMGITGVRRTQRAGRRKWGAVRCERTRLRLCHCWGWFPGLCPRVACYLKTRVCTVLLLEAGRHYGNMDQYPRELRRGSSASQAFLEIPIAGHSWDS